MALHLTSEFRYHSCLDRTNVAQFSAGVEAIGQQLAVMGIRSRAKLDPSSNIVRTLIDMYVDIGDSVALQYGGSEAHKKVQTAGTRVESINITGPIGKVRIFSSIWLGSCVFCLLLILFL
jgi:hypothetical protein